MLFLLAPAAPAVADAVQRSSLLGVNSWALLEGDAQFSSLRNIPIGGYRMPFSWARTEREAGAPYDFSSHDRVVAGAPRLGIRVLPILSDSPPWVRGSSTRLGEPPEPGYEMGRFEAFPAAAAARYG